MESTRLSSKGQVIIPKALRDAYHWETGQEFAVTVVEDGILLQPKRPFPPTTLPEVANCLPYSGPAKSVADMEQAIAKGVAAQQSAEDVNDRP